VFPVFQEASRQPGGIFTHGFFLHGGTFLGFNGCNLSGAAAGLRCLLIYVLPTAACNLENMLNWSVYIIRCDDGSLYTGISTDVERRFGEHLGSTRRAKFFNGRVPLEVVYREDGHSRGSAARREAAIKKLSRAEKIRLGGNMPKNAAP